jgi:hypothetical protein
MLKHGFRRAPWCYIDFEAPMPWRLRCDRCGAREDFAPPVTLIGTLNQCERFAERHFGCGPDHPYQPPPPYLQMGQIGMTETAHRELEERAGHDPIWKDLERAFVIFPEPSYLKIWICEHPPGYYEDNVLSQCSRCHAPIVHRPWLPKGAVKMCVSCAAAPGAIEGSERSE